MAASPELVAVRLVEKSPAKRANSKGICPVCFKNADCQYPNITDLFILQCGEFEAALPLQTLKGGKNVSKGVSTTGKVPSKEVSSSRNKGLCGNCDDNAVCVFNRPEGGVWFCEEYR